MFDPVLTISKKLQEIQGFGVFYPLGIWSHTEHLSHS